MTFYTNSNQIEELMKQLADVEVKPFNDLDPSTEVTVYLFDKELEIWARVRDSYWHVSGILKHCPDWGGTIMKLMMKCKEVYLFFGEWRRVVFHPEKNDFSFEFSKQPIMDADDMCLITTQDLAYEMRAEIQDMLEPISFGQAMADRIMGELPDVKVKSLLTFTKADYRDICLKMEQLMCDVMHQRDLWKDRFFFHATYSDKNDLCAICKEEMRQAFYVKGDEEAALKWRPGNREYKTECVFRNCKNFNWQAFEPDCDDDDD